MRNDSLDITLLLQAWQEGDEEALSSLLPLVFEELRRLARSHMSREAPGHTLQPTALVNEAYLRMMGGKVDELANRRHFFAFAAKLMRQILVDHARARQASKRGGDAVKMSLDLAPNVAVGQALELTTLLSIDSALAKLEKLDSRQGRIVELRYFSGLTLPEIAEVLDVSKSTVDREWSLARRWLAREMKKDGSWSGSSDNG